MQIEEIVPEPLLHDAGEINPGAANMSKFESFGEMAIGTLVASRESLPLHSRTYRLLTKSTLVVCLDYSDSEYLEQGIADACYPCWAL